MQENIQPVKTPPISPQENISSSQIPPAENVLPLVSPQENIPPAQTPAPKQITRNGNNFEVPIDDNLIAENVAELSNLAKKFGGTKTNNAQSFKFDNPSAAYSFQTAQEISKIPNENLREAYKEARIEDFPILKTQINDADETKAQKKLNEFANSDEKWLSGKAIAIMQNDLDTSTPQWKKLEKISNDISEEKISPVEGYNQAFNIAYSDNQKFSNLLESKSSTNIPKVSQGTLDESEKGDKEIAEDNAYSEMKVGDLKAVDAFKVTGEENMNAAEQNKIDTVLNKMVSYRGESIPRRELIERIATGEFPESAIKDNSTAKKYLNFLRGNFPRGLEAIKKAGLEQVKNSEEGKMTESDNNFSGYVGKTDNPATLENLKKLAETFGGNLKTNSKGNPIFEFDSAETRRNFNTAADIFLKNQHLKYFNQAEKAEITPQEEMQPVTTPEENAPVEAVPAPKAQRKRTGIFGTREEADKEFKEAFKDFDFVESLPSENTDNENDLLPKDVDPNDTIPADKFVNVVDDSDEALAKYVAEWNAEIKKMSAMPMFNPKLWTAGVKIGLVYVQRGINKFADWAKQITNTLGEKSKIWQPAIWEMLQTMPKIDKFNDKQITSLAKKIGNLYDDGIKDFADIRADFVKDFGEKKQSKLNQ